MERVPFASNMSAEGCALAAMNARIDWRASGRAHFLAAA